LEGKTVKGKRKNRKCTVKSWEEDGREREKQEKIRRVTLLKGEEKLEGVALRGKKKGNLLGKKKNVS